MRELGTLARASAVLESHFGVSSTYGSDGRSGVGARLRAHSKALVRWFGRHIKNPGETIRVPDFIMCAPKEIRFAYLSGVFDADGRIRPDGRLDSATTVYREFAEDLVALLSGLGIGSYLAFGSAERRRSNGENAQDFWTVSIVGNTNRRMFHEGCNSQSVKLNGRKSKDGPIDFSFPIRWAGSNTGYKASGNINVTAMHYDLPLLPTRVTSVERGRVVETYDIQVEGLERFTTNGLVVHNSACISLSNLS